MTIKVFAALIFAAACWGQNIRVTTQMRDVRITTPTDGQCLIYVAATSRWQNATCPNIGGGGLQDPGSAGLLKRTTLNVTVPAVAGTDYAAASHTHAATDVTSGTMDISRLPTGTTVGTVATGNHTHTADSILPSQTGNNGKFLTTNGTASSWASVAGGSGSSNLSGLSDVTISSPATNQCLIYNGTAWANVACPATGSVQTSVNGGSANVARGLIDFVDSSAASWVLTDTGTSIQVQAALPASIQTKISDQSSSHLLCSAGNTTTLTCTMSPTLSTYTDKMLLNLCVTGSISGATTLNVDTLGAKAVKTFSGSNPSSGDLDTGCRLVTYKSSDNSFRLPAGGSGGGSGHTQNTDTGTTSPTFALDSGSPGPLLKNSAGTLQIRNAADSAFAPLQALSFTAGDGTASSNVQFPELATNGSNYVALYGADSQSGNTCYVLPSAVGSLSQVLADSGSTATMSDGNVCRVLTWRSEGLQDPGSAGLLKRTTLNVTVPAVAGTDYAAASHTHAATDVTSGTMDISRLPTGTSVGTVATGNHTHTADSILPGQGGNNGKFLTTNGTTSSWATVAGSGASCAKYTVPYTSVQTGATTNSASLFTLPAQAKITGITIKHSTAFAGSGVSSVTVSVGKSGNSSAYSGAFDIFQSVSNTAMQDDGGHYSADFSSHSVTANFTSNVNLSNLSAGSVDIWACTVTLP